MNKKIMLSLFLFLLVMGISEAGMLPYATSGYVKYNGIALSEVEISVKNIDAGISIITSTDNEGFFLYTLGDWGNNDQIEIISCNVAINTACKQTKKIAVECPAMGGCDFNFDLTNPETIITKGGHTRTIKEILYVCEDGTNVDDKIDCPVKPEVKPEEKPTIIEYVCWNGVKVASENLCSKKPEIIVKEYVCSDGTKVENAEQCPEEGIFFGLIELLVIILAAIGVTWRAGYIGLAKYYWNKGEKARAIKMLFTATKRAKEDYYKKGK